MSDVGNVLQEAEKQAAVEKAAAELVSRLKSLADLFASKAGPRRVLYGPGRVGQLLRRQSPQGYVIDPVSLKVLLPDGRIWSYSRTESNRFPNGRVFDARVDYREFAGGRSFPGGREFIFLGAVLGKYSFGWAAPSEAEEESDPGGLRAIYGQGPAVRWATAEEAFTAIADSVIARDD